MNDCSEPMAEDLERVVVACELEEFFFSISLLRQEYGRMIDGKGSSNLISRESAQGKDFEIHRSVFF